MKMSEFLVELKDLPTVKAVDITDYLVLQTSYNVTLDQSLDYYCNGIFVERIFLPDLELWDGVIPKVECFF